MRNHLLPTAALAALALFATTAGSAQGLGGMLNQAKDKARQAADRAANQVKSDVLNGPSKSNSADGPSKTSPADGPPRKGNPAEEATTEETANDGPKMPETAAEQTSYARAMMADFRPMSVNDIEPPRNYGYRRLIRKAKIPLQLTWDDAAAQGAVDARIVMWNYIEYMCDDLAGSLQGEQGAYLKAALQKVKEIHLTRKRNPASYTNMWYSFNPGTGVLTAAINVDDGPEVSLPGGGGGSMGRGVADWILKNMTKAGKSTIELENEARFRYAREHPSSISTAPSSGGGSNGGSSAKSWTCTWCHQSVTATSRPSLAGCPRNSAHQHAWHN